MQTRSLLGPGGSPSFANVTIAAGGTFDLYNTADQTTNYERLRAAWTSNVAQISVQAAGTGTNRQLRVGASSGGSVTSYIGFYSQQFPFIETVLSNTASNGVLAELFKGSFTGSVGTQTIASIQPTINQSGTAGYTALDINPTETATGSGTKLLQRWAVGGTAVGQLYNNGVFYSGFVIGANRLGLSSTIGGAADIELNRDAADTLALRRSTNAQSFRIAQTYTDASNRRYLQMYFSGSQAIILNTGNGTAAGAGGLLLSSDSGGNLDFGVAGTAYWRVNGSGAHLLAVTDNTTDIGASGANRPRSIYAATSITSAIVISNSYSLQGYSVVTDGVTAPGATAGQAKLYVDTADGDLKIIFGDGTIKTIVTDT